MNTIPAAPCAGHRRTCAHCSAAYSSARATARYCSEVCKKRHQRGSHRGSAASQGPLSRWLRKRGYLQGSELTVPLPHVLAELGEAERRIRLHGLRYALPAYTEATLRTALAEVSAVPA